MPPDVDPVFEVATIKPSDTSAPHGTFRRTDGRHSIAYNFAFRNLIEFVHGVHKSQIVGGPKDNARILKDDLALNICAVVGERKTYHGDI